MSNKKLAKTLLVVLMITDIVVTITAWEIAYFIRFELMDNHQTGLFDNFLYYSFVLAALVVLFSTANHLYKSNQYYSWYKEFLLVVKSQLQSIATFIIILYFIKPNRLSRITIGLYIGIGIIIALIVRGIIRSLLRKSRLMGKSLRHVLIIGRGSSLEHYVDLLVKHPEKGVRFTGWIGAEECAKQHGIPVKSMEEISLEGQDEPDAVIIGYSTSDHAYLDETLNILNKTSIQTLVIPDIENAFIGYAIEEFHAVPMIAINSARLTLLQSFVKRLIDVVLSLLGIITLFPFFCIIALLVKLTSRGPVLYGQKRMSQGGEEFMMFKFRSMYPDAEKNGAQWAKKNDDRCTPIGRFLRKTSIDEFPQLWNVLKGEMSLVGPRPERPELIETFKYEIPSYMLRHRMKSGITGWAQVNGWRGDTSLASRIEFDLYYIRNWSLLLDVKILFLTVLKGFVNENAY